MEWGGRRIFSIALLSGFLSQGGLAREVVVATASIPPVTYEDHGQPAGIAVEILREAGKLAGIDFRFRFLPWPRAQLETQDGADVAIVPLTRTPEREPKYQWIADLFQYRLVLYSIKPLPKSLDEAKKLRVGTLRSSPWEKMLAEQGFKMVDPATMEATNAKKLAIGHIDLWATGDLLGKFIYLQAGEELDQLHYGLQIGEPLHVYIAGSRLFDDATAKAIAEAVARLKASGKVDMILKRYR